MSKNRNQELFLIGLNTLRLIQFCYYWLDNRFWHSYYGKRFFYKHVHLKEITSFIVIKSRGDVRLDFPDASHTWYTVSMTFATFRFPMMQFMQFPIKICISIVSNFSWNLGSSLEKFKTKLIPVFLGETNCIMGKVKAANSFVILRITTRVVMT